MPAVMPDITQEQIFTDLRAYLLTLDGDIEIVRGLDNRVAMPAGPEFIALTPSLNAPLSTPTSTYTDTTRTVLTPMQFTAQIDCYGVKAADRAQAIVSLFRTDYSVDSFAGHVPNIVPLYSSDPQQIPLVDGEQQYEERWTFNAVMQYNPRVTVAQETFNTVGSISLVNVDRVYPPGA